MTKTVRIASSLIALLAVIITLPAVLGANTDNIKTKKSSEVQSVVESFKKTRGDRAKKDTDQKPPLVKEAEDFALYLNPPKPPTVERERVEPPVERTDTALPPVQSISRTAKFNLIATCVHESNPPLSVALIDEPGRDRRWVRQSDVVGHLIIKEIKEGSVIINDGTRTYPLTMAERPVETSLVVGKSAADDSKFQTELPPVLLDNIGLDKTDLIEKQTPVTKRPAEAIRNRQRPAPIRSPEEQKLFDKFIEELGSIATESGDKAAKERSVEQADEMIKKLFSDIENTTRVSGKEAQKLDDLGKKLDSEKKDPNQPKADKTPASSRRRPPILR
jgi:hypothetical protein